MACPSKDVNLTNTTKIFLDDSADTLIASISLYAVLIVVLVVSFSAGLHCRKLAGILAPHLDTREEGVPCFFFGWIRRGYSMMDTIQARSMDGAVIISFCWLGVKFSFVASIIATGLLYLYSTESREALNSQEKLSTISTYKDGDFMVVVMAAYVLVGWLCHLLIYEWWKFLKLRRFHFYQKASGEFGNGPAQAARSVLVEFIPRDCRDEDSVESYFTNFFGEKSIYSCIMLGDHRADHGSLEAVLRKHSKKAVENIGLPLHDPEALAEQMVPPLVTGAFEGSLIDSPRTCCGNLVKDFCSGVSVAQEATLGESGSDSAFVTFHKCSTRLISLQATLNSIAKSEWSTCAVPDTKGIIWMNVSIPARQTQTRIKMSAYAAAVGLLFWSIPVSFIMTAANMDGLRQMIPALEPHIISLKEKMPSLYIKMVTYLPLWALMVLQLLMPYVFRWVAVSYEGHKFKETVEREVLRRNFRYQFSSLMLAVLAVSLFESFSWLTRIEGLSCMFEVMSTEIPKRAVYFINLVIARAGFSSPLLLVYHFLTSFWYLWNKKDPPPVYCDFGAQGSDIILNFAMGLTYMVIAPAMVYACLAYFLITTFVYLWLFAYVYTEEYDGTGAIWLELYNGVMAGMILGTVILLAIMQSNAQRLTKSSIMPSVEYGLVLTLLVIEVGFWVYCNENYMIPSQNNVFEDAVAVDRLWAEDPDCAEMLDPGFYTDPLSDAEDDGETGSASCELTSDEETSEVSSFQ